LETKDKALGSMNDLPSHHETGGPGTPGQEASPSGPTTSIPWITYTIIVICGAICAFLNLGKGFTLYVDIGNFLMPTGAAIWSGAYWGFFTSAFVHIAVWHILFNMWWLKDFGTLLEPSMGRIKFILFTLSAGAVSSGAQLAFTDDTGIGFSGVVYAMFGYMLATRNVEPVYQKIVDKRTIVWLLGWLVLCIILTVTGVWNVANGSHIAGFLFGLCIGYAFTARTYVLLSRFGLLPLIVLTVLSATYMPWSDAWLAKSGDYEAAIKSISKAIEKNPDNSVAYYNRGLSYFRIKKDQEALKDLNRAIEMGFLEPDAYGVRGNVFLNLGNYKEAIMDFDKVIQLNPNDARGYNGRAYVHINLRNHQRAINDFDKAIELNPGSADAYSGRGLTYLILSKNQEAIKDLDKAVELNPKNARIYAFRGDAYQKLGNYQRALAEYDKAIDLDTNNVDAYYEKTCTYSLMNNTEEACNWLQKSIEKGFNDWDNIKSDTDLNNIRNSSCYKEIMSGR
jgi:tetratricopeptide (TPR) repeat protein/membrane associated rhomboid family serine protease